MGRDIVEILRDLTLDWNGSEMPNGAESRVPIYCLELREAVEEIERLREEAKKAAENDASERLFASRINSAR